MTVLLKDLTSTSQRIKSLSDSFFRLALRIDSARLLSVLTFYIIFSPYSRMDGAHKIILKLLVVYNKLILFSNLCNQQVKIPSNQPLVSLSNLRYTAALTCPIQLQPSALYSPSLIIGWDNMCTFVGGINAPKRLTLRTSDGLKQFELLKGRDDIRQDAVMEQVILCCTVIAFRFCITFFYAASF